MSKDIAKVKERAAEYARKGNLKRAIEEYQKLVQLQPNDIRLLHQLGELLLRAERKQHAVDVFLQEASAQRKAGFSDRAVAVLKQALSVDPLRLDANLALAEAFLDKQFERDASAALLKAADALAQAGRSSEEIELLQRAVQLLPNDTQCKVRLGRSLRKMGRQEEAHQLIFSVSDQGQPAQAPDSQAAPVQKAVPPQPPPPPVQQEPPTKTQLAAEMLEQGQYEQALELLKELLAANSGDLKVLQMLAVCHLRQGDSKQALPLCKRLARLARRKGDREREGWALKAIADIAKGVPLHFVRQDEGEEAADFLDGEEDTTG